MEHHEPRESRIQRNILQGLRILVVDDNPQGRELLEVILSRWGAEVTTVASSKEALEEIDRAKPDLLLSDISMPEENGYGLISKVRALGPTKGGNIPAGALTAHHGADEHKRILAAGFQVHVPRPYEPADLVRIVAALAGRGLGPSS